MEEASSSQLLKGSGEGRIELKLNYKPNPPRAHLVHSSLIVYQRGIWLQSCFVVWTQIQEQESRERQMEN